MKVVLVISSLSSGGAERVMSMMANYWAEKGWDVTLVTFAEISTDFFPISQRIKRTGLGLLKPSANILQSLTNNVQRILSLRKTITELSPQVVISFMDITNIITLAAVGKAFPVIVSERVDPRYVELGAMRNFLRRQLYPYAAAVVLQTDTVATWAGQFVSHKKIKIIQNPLLQSGDTSSSVGNVSLAEKTVLAIGRLTEQKGFDLLINAFSSVCLDGWQLLIVGEGDDRPQLEKLIKSQGMEGRITLVGRVSNVQQYLEKASIFVLSSRFEGFPNVLLEAMSGGLPVISFDCPSGPGDIINDGEDGLLVPSGDVGSLATAMSRLMADEQMRRRLGKKAEFVRERFAIDHIMGQWERVLEGLR
jgi:glycosyltransferase involved in cell wall biosynthesis